MSLICYRYDYNDGRISPVVNSFKIYVIEQNLEKDTEVEIMYITCDSQGVCVNSPSKLLDGTIPVHKVGWWEEMFFDKTRWYRI